MVFVSVVAVLTEGLRFCWVLGCRLLCARPFDAGLDSLGRSVVGWGAGGALVDLGGCDDGDDAVGCAAGCTVGGDENFSTNVFGAVVVGVDVADDVGRAWPGVGAFEGGVGDEISGAEVGGCVAGLLGDVTDTVVAAATSVGCCCGVVVGSAVVVDDEATSSFVADAIVVDTIIEGGDGVDVGRVGSGE